MEGFSGKIMVSIFSENSMIQHIQPYSRTLSPCYDVI